MGQKVVTLMGISILAVVTNVPPQLLLDLEKKGGKNVFLSVLNLQLFLVFLSWSNNE